jgi:putative ABC transport system substrate-binding protein
MAGTTDSLTRRQLVQGVGLAGLALLAGCGRLPWQGQPELKLARIGYLANPPGEALESLDVSLRRGLRELGYVEGQNLVIEYRSADGQTERLPELAAELVRLPVDIILTVGPSAAPAAKAATATIPIVMAPAGTDPVGQGLIQSFAHPGGNVTGIAGAGSLALHAKRLELLMEVLPGATRVAALWSPGNPVMPSILTELQEAGPKLGVQVRPLEVPDATDFEGAFAAANREQVGGVILLQSPLMRGYGPRAADLALQSGLPTMHQTRDYVVAGGLMAYYPDEANTGRRAAYYVDRILKGTKPADLPVELPTTFEFIINLKTAQALGLTIPEHVLLQATEVIQ